MTRIQRLLQKGITSYHLKMIAMLFMTIDHIGAYGFRIPYINEHHILLRLLGRISAPLFLYMLTESVRYTHSKARFIFRLYIGAVMANLFVSATNFFAGDTIGNSIPSNIIFTYFYVALFIVTIDELVASIKAGKWFRGAVITLSITVCIYLLHVASVLVLEHEFSEQLYSDICRSFLKSPIYVEYTPVFILLGILLYYTREKKYQIITFILFCMISYSHKLGELFFMTPLVSFFSYPQYWMVLATPFLALYNGERGNEQKLLFYIYYPVHTFLIKLGVHLLIG